MVDFTLTLYKSQANSDIVLVVYVDTLSSLPREKVETLRPCSVITVFVEKQKFTQSDFFSFHENSASVI